MAIFFSAATAAGAFGGLLARGIMELEGKCGLASWSWIFIIEGALTVVIGKLLSMVSRMRGLCSIASLPQRFDRRPV
jgi:hypothetical protein